MKKNVFPSALLLFFLTTLFFLILEFKPLPAAKFVQQSAIPTNLPPFFASDFLPRAAPSAHASTMTILPNNQLMAAWFAGAQEGAKDVAIFTSILQPNGWSTPQKVADRASLAGSIFANVRKIGNPVLFTLNHRVYLWFVSVGVGGWAGSQINLITSDDNGITWSKAKRLVTSPLINISTLVRTSAIRLQNNEIALPVYHEWLLKYGELLRMDENGNILMKSRMPQRQSLQPSLIVENAQTAHAFLRDSSTMNQVQHLITHDGGALWQKMPPSPLPNPNSSVATLKLPDGKWLLVGNEQNRHVLNAWISQDQGKTWHLAKQLENGESEYSYPFLLLDLNGAIHLTYTWQRKTIRHMIFSQAWLENTP